MVLTKSTFLRPLQANPVTALLALFTLVASLGLPPSLQGQVGQFGAIKNWKYLEYQNQQPPAPGKTNLLKTLITGQTALPQKDGAMLVQGMRLENFKMDGTTNLTATAPECLTDIQNHNVSSPGPLEVTTAHGQLSIRGRGFFCAYSNVVLLISNQVETTVHRGLMRPESSSIARLATPPSPSAPALTNLTMRIFSDTFEFLQASNTVNFLGRVRVDDPLLTMTCDTLAILLATNGAIDKIVADGSVALEAKSNPSQAQGDHAVYHLQESHESILLSGAPATWNDGLRSGWGGQLIFEPRDNRVTAFNGSKVRVPRADLHQPDFNLKRGAQEAGPAAQTQPKTNEFVEISAFHMDFKLETTNRTGRSLLASNEVVILSESDQSRATGRQATYAEETGIFELTGDAVWESRNRRVEGQTLRFDRTNQVFSALQEAFLKLPLSALGGSLAVSHWLDLTNAGPDSAQFVEVSSAEGDYRAGQLQFRSNVTVRLLAGDSKLLGHMFCQILTLRTNQQGHHVLAQGQITVEQVPTAQPNGAIVEKRLQCEHATVDIGTNGLVRSMVAETNVLFRQIEQHPDIEAPSLTELAAQIITAVFASDTNQVDSVVAERDVVITQNTGGAKSDLAIYDRVKDSLLLSGEVTLESPRGILSAPAAVLKHFGLWPGKLNRVKLPASGRPSAPSNPNPPPPSPL